VFFLALLVQDSLFSLLAILFILSVTGLMFVLYGQLIHPIVEIRRMDLPPPVNIGDKYFLVVDSSERYARHTIGKLIGNIATRVGALQDEHLVFQFKRARDSEDYDIIVQRNSAVLYQHPKMDVFAKMESIEKLESHELIGHEAKFRLGNKISKDRMTHFVEITLSTEFYFNRLKEEKLRYIFTITRIQPGLNRMKANKDKSFPWGKEEEIPEEVNL
jgi:hypothetical protein